MSYLLSVNKINRVNVLSQEQKTDNRKRTMDLVQLVIRYKALAIDEVINHEKFNHISIVHHSTKIEGSTLTEVETQVLLSDGLTPKGKPLQDSLMVTDHYTALLFTLQEAKIKRVVSTKLIQEINSIVVKNTARIYNTIFGTIDASIGAFRKGNVTAGSSYFPNFDKVADLTQKMTQAIQEQMQQPISILEQLHLSFVAHFNLVSIHPFYDGNGRTSRLLMNYIQAYYGLPLAIVYNESKAEYIEVLIATREQDDIEVFKAFMTTEYARMLTAEIQKFEDMKKPSKGRDFTLLF